MQKNITAYGAPGFSVPWSPTTIYHSTKKILNNLNIEAQK